MAEPASSTAATLVAAIKIWSLIASVAGSVIPLLALSDRKKLNLKHAAISAAVGASFAIFVGPWVAIKFDLTTPEATSALSWVMGGTGVYIVRAFVTWMEERGPFAIDRLVNKLIDTLPGEDRDEEEKELLEETMEIRHHDEFGAYSHTSLDPDELQHHNKASLYRSDSEDRKA